MTKNTKRFYKRPEKSFIDSIPRMDIWLFENKERGVHGKIIAYAKPNRNWGYVGHAGIFVWGGENKWIPCVEGKASGYGYDKISSSISSSARGILEQIGKFITLCDEDHEIVASPEVLQLLTELGRIGAGGKECVLRVVQECGFECKKVN